MSEQTLKATHTVRISKNEKDKKSVKKAILSTYVLFALFGVVYISFLSRIVEIRHLLGDITPAQAGSLLLCVSLGSTTATPIGGALLEKVSIRKFIRVFAFASAVFLVLFGFLASLNSFFGCAIVAVFMGVSYGLFNVSNNVAGVSVERRANGRTLMPRFHSFFQLGAVFATLFSQIIAYHHFDIRMQYIVVALFVIIVAFVVTPNLYSSIEKEEEVEKEESEIKSADKLSLKERVFAKGVDSRLLLIGMTVCACTLAEGAGNDWIAAGVVESFKVTEAQGLTAMWIYLLITALTRFFGASFLDRFDRVLTMRICFGLAICGVFVYCLSPFVWSVYLACVLWGAGVAFGYPVGVTAASESGKNPAFRASVVASLGTIMNIAGPPVIGILANIISIRLSLLLLLPGLIVTLSVLRVLKPVKSS